MTITSTSALPCEAIDGHAAFRHLNSIEGIAVDLRYATPNTRRPRPVNPLDCAWLHRMRRPRWNRRWHGWRASALATAC
jgi:hypothetical protein